MIMKICSSAGRRTMGEIDRELNHFLMDNQVFADVINLSIYGGRQAVHPEELTEAGTVLYPEDHRGKRRERRNDVSKRCGNGSTYQIFCLENESKINYIMPVRGMEYEAGRYREQIRKIAAGHRDNDYHDWGERSSGFTRTDRLHPIVTLILYWRREPWDGAKNLIDMLDMDASERRALAPFLQDYKLNLVNMYDLKDTRPCNSQLKYILRLLQLDDNREAMYEEIRSDSAYRQLQPDTGKVISALLGDEKLRKCINEQNIEGGTINMCKALDDMWKDAETRGLKKGENYFARLTEHLLTDARLEDLKKAIENPVFRNELYREYGIAFESSPV